MKKSVVASLLVVALLGTSLAPLAQGHDIDQLHDYEDGDQADQHQLQDDEDEDQLDDDQLLNDLDDDPAKDYHTDLLDDATNGHNNNHERKRRPRNWLSKTWNRIKHFVVNNLGTIIKVGRIVARFLRTGEVKLLGHSCRYSQESFQGYHRGLIVCPGWASIVGQAVTQDSSKVLQAAIENFLKKAVKSGLITEKDLEDFLQSATTEPPTAS